MYLAFFKVADFVEAIWAYCSPKPVVFEVSKEAFEYVARGPKKSYEAVGFSVRDLALIDILNPKFLAHEPFFINWSIMNDNSAPFN